jgi:Flp pilus assembly protein TadG
MLQQAGNVIHPAGSFGRSHSGAVAIPFALFVLFVLIGNATVVPMGMSF